MALWFFNKVVWFVLAIMLEGILLPSNMAAKTTFCLHLVKLLIVMFRCATNVTTSFFNIFLGSLSAKFVFRKKWFVIFKITFWSRDQLQTYSFYDSGAGLKNQISIILFRIWPTNHFLKAKLYNFHLHKTMSHDLLVQMAYSHWNETHFDNKDFANSEMSYDSFSVITIWKTFLSHYEKDRIYRTTLSDPNGTKKPQKSWNWHFRFKYSPPLPWQR